MINHIFISFSGVQIYSLVFHMFTYRISCQIQKHFFQNMSAPGQQQEVYLKKFVYSVSTVAGIPGGRVLPKILDRGVPRRFLNPNPL